MGLARGDSGDAVLALQCDLFAAGFQPGLPDSDFGPSVEGAVKAFQSAAQGADRVQTFPLAAPGGGQATGFRRVQVAPTYSGAATGAADDAMLAELASWRTGGTCWLAADGEYAERRVRVDPQYFVGVPSDSPLLVPVPSSDAPCRLHVLAAAALGALSIEVKSALGIDLAVASGWRKHRWASREEYEATLVARYGSVDAGKAWLGFDSPHELGLAADLGCGGLEPVSATAAQQRQTPLFAWLRANAWRFGWHPYLQEPWHWEFPASFRAFRSGQSDFAPA